MILLGVTGSIAAYKAVEIARLLIKAGEDVHAIMTPSATHFVGPLTFRAITGHPVFSDPLDPQAYQMAHLTLAEKASAVLVAPATAETLSHLARGGAGDLISAIVLAVPRRAKDRLKIPVFIAPAMHAAMWLHPATQANVKQLKGYGYRFIGPEKGALGRAGDNGEGRMSEPTVIVQQVLRARS
jgi:phosphopantothenoylcysteine decarboxylase/phosphopantothenate--cysteine ligase